MHNLATLQKLLQPTVKSPGWHKAYRQLTSSSVVSSWPMVHVPHLVCRFLFLNIFPPSLGSFLYFFFSPFLSRFLMRARCESVSQSVTAVWAAAAVLDTATSPKTGSTKTHLPKRAYTNANRSVPTVRQQRHSAAARITLA